MAVQGKCRLWEQQSDLQESHIVPKFVYAYLKVNR